MDGICTHCGVWSRSPCSQFVGANRFDGCMNLSREQQLVVLAGDGVDSATEMLELIHENERLREETASR